MIKINGKEYGGVINVQSITESFEKVYGESSVVKQNGEDWYDVIGTRYIHQVVFTQNPSVTPEESDEFFELISSPNAFQVVTLPHGSGEITYNAHISAGSRQLIDFIDGKYIWDDNITLTFRAAEPQRRSDT